MKVLIAFFTHLAIQVDGYYSSAPRFKIKGVMNEKQSLVVVVAQIPRWVLLRAVQLIRLSAVDSTQHGIVVPLRVPLHGGACGDYHCV